MEVSSKIDLSNSADTESEEESGNLNQMETAITLVKS